MARIETKEEFYRLYYKLALGNTIAQFDHPEWCSLRSERAVPKKDLWVVRVKIPAHPYMKYEMSEDEADDYARWLINEKRLPADKVQFSECMPDYGPNSGSPVYLTLQGEVMRSPDYFSLMGVTDFKDDAPSNRLRTSIDRAKPYYGLQANRLLKQACDPSSWDMLSDLFDQYPDSVIEFACYSRPVGLLERNMIIWEVRNY